jgi:hypothetical protein
MKLLEVLLDPMTIIVICLSIAGFISFHNGQFERGSFEFLFCGIICIGIRLGREFEQVNRKLMDIQAKLDKIS